MATGERLRLHLWISGRVQGVFFRGSAQTEARRLGLRGWVRNLEDGRVELVAEGPAAEVRSLAAWCRRGPPGAFVTGIEEHSEEPTGESRDFRVAATG